MVKKTKRIYLFGPHDRFNYGDLLFPILLEYAIGLKSNNDYLFIKASIVDSDLSKRGAFKSVSYKKFKKGINPNDILIVTGGQSLKARWKILLSFIKWWYNEIAKRPRIFKIFKKFNLEKKIFGAGSEFPFCINKNEYHESIKIMYNSVGGGVDLNESQIKNLNDSDYVAVRDLMSFNFLKEKLSRQVHLVPDSAIILSDVFPLEGILKRNFLKNTRVVNFIEKKENYIFFQISKARVNNKLDDIVKELEALSKKSLNRIVLCPIGTALGHEDHKALKIIHQKLNCKKAFFDSPTLQDILLLLIHSKLYIGSSLHGAITAMSYGIPYITLDKRQKKIQSYLKTWSIDNLSKVHEVDRFSTQALIYLETKKYLKEEILEKSKIQKEIYYQSIERMINLM